MSSLQPLPPSFAPTVTVPDDAVIAVDVGNHAYSFGRYFECKRHTVLMSGYLGSIGFGYPAAMGAWAAAPDRPIVAVTGDGARVTDRAELDAALAAAVAHDGPAMVEVMTDADLV